MVQNIPFCEFSDPCGIKPHLKFGQFSKIYSLWMETLEKLFCACFWGDIDTPHPTKRQKHDKRKMIWPQRKRNYFIVPQCQLSHLTGRNSSALQASSWTPHKSPLLEIRSHYLESRICKELPATASRENCRQERIPAFISAIWGIFLPEKQCGLGLLKTGQNQKQGFLHKEDASTKLPLLLCERNESNHWSKAASPGCSHSLQK